MALLEAPAVPEKQPQNEAGSDLDLTSTGVTVVVPWPGMPPTIVTTATTADNAPPFPAAHATCDDDGGPEAQVRYSDNDGIDDWYGPAGPVESETTADAAHRVSASTAEATVDAGDKDERGPDW
jgi:hypothetical protein